MRGDPGDQASMDWQTFGHPSGVEIRPSFAFRSYSPTYGRRQKKEFDPYVRWPLLPIFPVAQEGIRSLLALALDPARLGSCLHSGRNKSVPVFLRNARLTRQMCVTYDPRKVLEAISLAKCSRSGKIDDSRTPSWNSCFLITALALAGISYLSMNSSRPAISSSGVVAP